MTSKELAQLHSVFESIEQCVFKQINSVDQQRAALEVISLAVALMREVLPPRIHPA